VQKLYEKRVLHDILGIKPQISKVRQDAKIDDPLSSSSSNAKNSQAVESAWASAAPGDGLDHEDQRSRGRRHSESSRHDERGRYDIEPTKKRWRVERSPDAHTSYITDEEDDRSEDELKYWEEKYRNGRSGEDRSSRLMNGDRGKRCDYWLAKAAAIGGAANDT